MKRRLQSALVVLAAGLQIALAADGLPGTEALAFRESTAEIVQRQLEQVRSYWRRRIAQAGEDRDARWRAACTSAHGFEGFAAAQRAKCRAMLGLDKTDPVLRPAKVELLAANDSYRLERVEVPLPGGIAARGVLVAPARAGRHAAVIVCADADTRPE
ncbi:MAG: hypothetical protein N2689_01680, partial [Verrucomicrobiae bacterium]|nr:hypothetical protein [Verrucomicrobiae bacterium]